MKWPHQRAAMVLDMLDAVHDVTAVQMVGIAFSLHLRVAERATQPDHICAQYKHGFN